MGIVDKKTLEEWMSYYGLSLQHIEFLKKHVIEWKDIFLLPDGSSRPAFVRLSAANLGPIDSAIISTILSKEENYRLTYSRGKEFGTNQWQYLKILPDSDEYIIDISLSLGIIWIWDELQKEE